MDLIQVFSSGSLGKLAKGVFFISLNFGNKSEFSASS
jgi:hypothetical protein